MTTLEFRGVTKAYNVRGAGQIKALDARMIIRRIQVDNLRIMCRRFRKHFLE